MNVWRRRGLTVGASAALALTCGAWGAAQTTPQTTPQTNPTAPQSTAPQATTETTPQSTQQAPAASPSTAAQSPGQPAHRTLQLVQAQAQLDKTIDAKKAKQGDVVTAKLVADVKIPDAEPLPRSTVLEGHVDQVTPSEHKSDSTMVVTFDKAKLKDGQEVPIKATIMAMAEPAMMNPDAGGGGGGGAPAGGMAPSGGGGASGSAGGARSGGGGSAGASSPAPEQTPSANMADSGGGGSQQAQSVPDVKLTSNIHEHNSATLTSKGKNVHVPDGTQMELAIGIVPAGVTLQ